MIIEQNVTSAAGIKTLDNSPNLFTIADLSNVWMICDVFENDLPHVHMGEYAEIHLIAYPESALKGRITNIGQVLDPNIRDRQSSHRGRTNPACCASACSSRRRSTGSPQKCARPCPRARCCGFTIAIGFTSGRTTASSGARRGRRRKLPGNMQEIVSRHKIGRSSGAERLIFECGGEQ